MDLPQQYLYYLKTYFCIGTYITHHHRDHIQWIVCVSAEQMPDNHLAIKHETILLSVVHDLHHDSFLYPSDSDSSNSEDDSETQCIGPE